MSGSTAKANWRSLAPLGRKGVSAHWFLQLAMGLGRHRARRAGADLRIFVFDFSFPSDGARNVRREGILLFFVIVHVDAI